MAVKSSPPALAFAKALRSLETGGLTYSDVLAEIKELLAAGASPTELREVLLGRDLIEPLSAQARVEILGLLNGAVLRERKRAAAAAEALNTPPEVPEHLRSLVPAPGSMTTPSPGFSPGATEKQDEAVPTETVSPSATATAAIARVSALEAELSAASTALESERNRARDAAKAAAGAAADSLASLEAARSRVDEAAEDAERHRIEAVSLRDALSERDSNLGQLRQTLSKRDAQFTALSQEHAEMSSALEARAKSVAQLQADLQIARTRESALTADLAKARAALESEQSRAQGNSKSLVDKLVATEADLAALQREHANQARALDVQNRGSAQLGADLQSARARADALSAELKSSQETALALSIRLDRSDSVLATVRAELEDVKGAHGAHTAAPPSSQVIKFPQSPPVSQSSTHAKVEPTPAPRVAPVSASGEKAGVPGISPRTRPRIIAIVAAIIIAIVGVWLFNQRRSAPQEAKTPVPVVDSPTPGKTIRDCPTCPAMTVLPAGRFKQGSPGGEGDTPSFERPQHWVNIGKPLAMSTNPITVEEFGQFIAANERDMQGCDVYDGAWKHRPDKNWKDPGFTQTGEHPVTCVSSNDAAAYAAWLSTRTGHRYRLPSASEWEYAARAGGEAVQPWGPVAADACRYANVADQSAADQYPGWRIFDCDDANVNTSPVGSFEANAFGLKDMLGNVFQWTDDCWNADYTGAPVDGSARSDGDCTQRELRGGSWFSSPDYVRANYRNRFAADYRTSSVGIRLVRELAP
jgi:formylglycine-generating enzyme